MTLFHLETLIFPQVVIFSSRVIIIMACAIMDSATSPALSEYNILLLGEPGVGKTLAINAFATYLNCADFAEAKSSDLVDIIPAKFTLTDPNTGNPLVIETGANVVHQLPMSYSFQFGDRIIRFIDTPGFGGNLDGVEEDEKYFERIFEYLSSLHQLNAICILAKAIMIPLPTSFRFFLTELFSRLHKNSHKNIFFCFTFSRTSFYEPGAGFDCLEHFFHNELKEMKFELCPNENCFFLDNESYCYLVANKWAFSFTEIQQATYEQNWTKSSEQARELFLNIFNAEPHIIEQSLSVNNSRNMRLKLAKNNVGFVDGEKHLNSNDNLDVMNKVGSNISESKQSKVSDLNIFASTVYNIASVLTNICYAACKKIVDSFFKSSVVSRKCSENCTTDSLSSTDEQPSANNLIALSQTTVGGNCDLDDTVKLPELIDSMLMNSSFSNCNDSIRIEEVDSDDEFFESDSLHCIALPHENVVFKTSEPALRKSLLQVPEYNILLLGETGAGKSTSINALANYLKYSSFEDATNNDFVQLIPSKFTLPNPVTGEPMEIVSGSDNNERSGDGNSSTQSPVGYNFRFGRGLIRLIDTPGMGDTTGVDADNLNFDKILNYLHHHNNLHGICILIKSTETRKTAYFRYCINELLTHLHKSACRNIIFCFTFSRNSFYGPGEGFSTLRGFLMNELKDVQLPLKPKVNCFFIDNEAYRFLVAKKQGYPFMSQQENSYKESWNISVQQTELMMETIMGLKPHLLNETCSLNNARKLILELAEPMVQLQANINANIAHIKAEEDRIKNSNQSREVLARNLHVEVDDLEIKELKYPTTVCTASKCTEVIIFDGQPKVNYKTRCHFQCSLSGVTVNTIGHPILKHCLAMSGEPYCQGKTCGCPWDLHMHQCVEYIKVKRLIIDTNKQIEIKNVDDAIKQIDKTISQMRQIVLEYQQELKVIHDVCAKFSYILTSNSNTPYNRFIEPYLNLLLDEEQKKMSANLNYSRAAYDSLVKMKATHQESVRILSKAIKNKSQQNVCIEDIAKFRDQLFQLKHSGAQLRQILKVGVAVRKTQFEYTERAPVYFSKASGIFSSNFRYVSKKAVDFFGGSKKKMITTGSNENKVKNEKTFAEIFHK